MIYRMKNTFQRTRIIKINKQKKLQVSVASQITTINFFCVGNTRKGILAKITITGNFNAVVKSPIEFDIG